MGEKIPLRWLKFEEAKDAASEPMITVDQVGKLNWFVVRSAKYYFNSTVRIFSLFHNVLDTFC